MTNIQKIICETYVPQVGVTYYLFRNFSGKLFISDNKNTPAELISQFVWSG